MQTETQKIERAVAGNADGSWSLFATPDGWLNHQRPIRLLARTLPFQGNKGGSIPPWDTNQSAGRSIGRTAVSKTVDWVFDALPACHQ